MRHRRCKPWMSGAKELWARTALQWGAPPVRPPHVGRDIAKVRGTLARRFSTAAVEEALPPLVSIPRCFSGALQPRPPFIKCFSTEGLCRTKSEFSYG